MCQGSSMVKLSSRVPVDERSTASSTSASSRAAPSQRPRLLVPSSRSEAVSMGDPTPAGTAGGQPCAARRQWLPILVVSRLPPPSRYSTHPLAPTVTGGPPFPPAALPPPLQ